MLILIILFIPFSHAYSSEYTVREFIYNKFTELGNVGLGRSAAVISTRFDEPIYLNLDDGLCPATSYVPPLFSDCTLSSDPENCVDGGMARIFSGVQGDVITLKGRVLNPLLCTKIVIGLASLVGNQEIMWNTQNSYADGIEFGDSTEIRICCSRMNEIEPNWNGTFSLTITLPTNTTFKLHVADKQFVEASHYIWKPIVYLNCTDGYVCNTERGCGNGTNKPPCCPVNYEFPINNTLYNVFKAETDSNFVFEEPIKNDTITHSILIKIEQNSNNACYRFPESRFPLCTISYKGVYSANGSEITPSNLQPLKNTRYPCNNQDFIKAKGAFENATQGLDALKTADLYEIQRLLVSAVSEALSDTWYGCLQTANELINEKKVFSLYNTSNCHWDALTNYEEYNNDPCCNNRLLETQCCVPSLRNISSRNFNVIEDQVNKLCSSPKCSMSIANSYAALKTSQANRESCTKSSAKEFGNPAFFNSPFVPCFSRIYPISCSEDTKCQKLLGKDSVCYAGYCTVPCQTNADCLGGNLTECFNGICTILGFRQDNLDEQLFADCLSENVDPYIDQLLREEIEKNDTSDSTYASKLFKVLFDPACYGTSISLLAITDEPECLSNQYCNWADCIIDGISCTQENCLDPIYSSNGYFCGECDYSGCFDISRTPHCVPGQIKFWANESECSTVPELTFNPLAVFNINAGGVLRPVYSFFPESTFETCVSPERCDPSVYPDSCPYYCEIPGIQDETSCLSYTPSGNWPSFDPLNVWFWNYTYNGITYNHCVVDSVTNFQCVESGEGKFFPGSYFLGAYKFDSEANCGACFINDRFNSSILSRTDCLNTYTCTANCSDCTTAEECSEHGTCDDYDACFFPQEVETGCLDIYQCIDGGWTPSGCYVKISQNNCTLLNGTWIPKATDELTCLTKVSQICIVGNPILGTNKPSILDMPDRYSYKNQSECTKCGGNITSFYKWNTGKWLQGEWQKFNWIKREVSTLKWERQTSTIAETKFETILNSARVKRFTLISKNELLCSYGELKDTLDSISCACGDDSCQSMEFANQTTTYITGLFTICDSVLDPIDTKVSNLSAKGTLVLSSKSFCLVVTQVLVPKSQFETNKVISLSKTSIASTQDNATEVTTIKNQYGVVVGEWIGDGYGWTFTEKVLNGSIESCIFLPNDQHYPIKDVVSTTDFKTFTLLGLSLPGNSTVACINITGESVIYFPVGLVSDWETKTYVQSWPTSIRALLFCSVALHTILFIACIAVLALMGYQYIFLKSKPPAITLIALPLLALFLFDRILFFFLTAFGVLNSIPPLQTIFSELPDLIFLSICSTICVKWAEVYHYKVKHTSASSGQLSRALVIGNVILYVVFFILLIIYFAVDNTVKYNCLTPDDVLNQIKAPQVIAYLYRALFVLSCIILGIAFAFYGYQIFRFIKKREDSGSKSKSLLQLLLMSTVCTITLYIQAIQLIVRSASNTDGDGITTLLILLITEIPSCSFMLIIFGQASYRSADKSRNTRGTAQSMQSVNSRRSHAN